MLADINGNLADLRSEAAMASQRFCLRWNNHQSNLLSVFDQLLHDEAFVDVTLAVEGQLLKAHKMVLSACSPYFQALFTNHPDKHPIVILKDVPYTDMRSLLDFMYRGEVSVDQERLTAFLRVAESLRIKGLTEVNEEKCDLPSITSSLLANQNNAPPPPPNLHRINQLGQHHLTQKRYHQLSNHPMLGSALAAPKRKRGRPRKLSGSSDTPMDTSLSHEQQCSDLVQGSPEMMEMKMGLDFQSEVAQNSSAGSSSAGSSASHNNQNSSAAKRDVEPTENGTEATEAMLMRIKGEPEPTPGTSAQDFTRSSSCSSNSSVKSDVSDKSRGMSTPEKSTTPSALQQQPASNESSPRVTPNNNNSNNNNNNNNSSTPPTPSSNTKTNSSSNGSSTNNSIASTQSSTSTTSTATTTNTRTTTTTTPTTRSPSPRSSSLPRGVPSTPPSQQQQQQTQSSGAMSAPAGRQVPKRRMRRKTSSQSQDPAEQLTEMSVRGLNLFRYASISEGVYQCTECAKVDVQKTFKNKYSFQRHAFLYHEGHQRKVFPCPVCHKEFSRPDKMKNHMKTVHDCFVPKDCVNLPFGFFMQP